MSAAPTFRDTIRRISPPWLQAFWGQRLLYAIAVHLDLIGDTVTAAVKARFPGLYTSETLAITGRERGIRRGFDELDASYAAREIKWFDSHKRRGNPYSMMREVQAFLGTHALKMRIVNNAGAWYTKNADGTTAYQAPPTNWNWDSNASKWSRFWLILYPNGLWTKAGAWGAGAVWGPNTFNNVTWGSNATRDQIMGIQAIVDDCRGPHSKCEHIIVAFDNASFDPAGAAPPLPDGTWKNFSKIVGGLYVPARLSTALYWDGSLTVQ